MLQKYECSYALKLKFFSYILWSFIAILMLLKSYVKFENKVIKQNHLNTLGDRTNSDRLSGLCQTLLCVVVRGNELAGT